MSARARVVHLQDLDLLIEEIRALPGGSRHRPPAPDPASLEVAELVRARELEKLDRRWSGVYERARQRYGRGVAAVRDRTCQGCFITLPTSAAPASDSLLVCESCGRILFWT